MNRWVSRFRRDGSFVARKRPEAGPLLIDKVGEAFISETLEDIPDSTIRELVECYQEEFGVKVPLTTMKRTLSLLGFTRKGGPSVHQTSTGPMLWQRGKPS